MVECLDYKENSNTNEKAKAKPSEEQSTVCDEHCQKAAEDSHSYCHGNKAPGGQVGMDIANHIGNKRCK